MPVSVGTFNLNNLFSRFNFEADVSTAKKSTVETKTTFTFSDPSGFKMRTYKGRLVKEKPEAERKLIAARIKQMDLDVLAVQEVEDINTLRRFVREDLGGLYNHSVLIEGNDPRLIDVGVLSKRPIGGAPGPVTASLVTGTASGDGHDSLTAIEQLDGSPFGDTFTGDSGNNGFNIFGGDDTVMAGAGDDWANGGDGNDSLYGEAGNEYLDGGDGVDSLDGGPDWDTCVNGETTINCES
jgi:Ca2+-binding RTX toxin-like protein